jgi:hypothetical protein
MTLSPCGKNAIGPVNKSFWGAFFQKGASSFCFFAFPPASAILLDSARQNVAE